MQVEMDVTAAQEAPAVPLGRLPQYQRREPRVPDSPDGAIPAASPASPASPGSLAGRERESLSGLPQHGAGRPGSPAGPGIRTGSSSAGSERPSARDTAKVVGGLLLAGIGLVGLVVRLRHDARLRKPTGKQLDDMAAPLARLALRYVPAEALSPTLLDVTGFVAATTEWLGDGPLLERAQVDPGVPAGLNTREEES
ncbi:MAG TPA: hypothetical protein VHA75_01070 [Rugosimonospora sp.]|nr:hypothetical protein [Rugosimonospora sp.]